MKNKAWIMIGLASLCLTVSGCSIGSHKDSVDHEATLEQTQEEEAPSAAVIEMETVKEQETTEEQKQEEPDKVIGSETETALRMLVTNQAGDEITYLFIRNNDDEDWGEERIGNGPTIADGEKAVLYFEKDENAVLYDLRIGFADEDKSELFFRKLPLDTITEISLCMEGTDEDGIPYARYKTTADNKEVSTLLEVKVRLGLLTEEEAQEIAAAEAAQVEFEVSEEETPKEATKEDAQTCIGKPLKALTDLCGQPRKTTYKNETETGLTGYHEYKKFTVSTTVEEDGNEIVAGVW